MKLSEIHDQLVSGELKQVVMGLNSTDTTMSAAKQAQILPLITLGLTELHKRFKLKESTTDVTLIAGTSDYSLALITDLMQIERITATYQKKDYEVSLNSRGDNAARTPSYNKIILPTDSTKAPWLLESTKVVVTYRADHPVIDVALSNAAPTIVDISLPNVYLEPLLYYVAARATNAFGGAAQGFHEGNNYTAKFEQACALLKQETYDIDQEESWSKLHMRGFV